MPDSKKNKILVVDDSSSNRLMLSFVLQEMGYETDDVENGEIAVEKALEFSYIAIFMDINIPVMNGVEAAEILRNLNFIAPIFAYSAEDDPIKISEYIDIGFTDYLIKPIEPTLVAELLSSHNLKPEIQAQDTLTDKSYQDKLDQLANRFRKNVPIVLKNVNIALKNHSMQDLQRIAHKLKGTASQFGFNIIAKLGRDIELAIKQGNLELALEKVSFLIKELKKVSAEN